MSVTVRLGENTALALLAKQGAETARDAAEGFSDNAAASASTLASLVSALTTLSGYLASVADADDNFLFGSKEDASFWTALTGDVDDAIATLQSSSPSLIASQSGILYGFSDASANDIAKIDDTGDLWTQGHNLTEFMRDVGTPISADLYPSKDIYWWGDSLAENWASASATLASALSTAGDTESRTITRVGLGGQDAAQILGRQGGRPCQITFPTGASGRPEIPASGAATVTLNTGILNHPGTSNVEAQALLGTVQVQDGVYGTLTRLAGGTTYTFTRATAGSIIKVPPKVSFIPDNATQRRATAVCWIGTNDMIAGTAAATIATAIDDYVAGQLTLQKRCVILMPTWNFSSTDRRTTYDALWAILAPKYGDRLIDTIGELAAYGDGSSNDNADIAAGYIPRSLMNGDRIHFPDGGTAYARLADRIAQIIVRNNW